MADGSDLARGCTPGRREVGSSIEELAARVAQLEQRLDERDRSIEAQARLVTEKEAELERLRSEPAPEAVTGRRQLLVRAGLGAAGLVAGGAALVAGSEPAAANDNDPLLLGVATNTASSGTSVVTDVTQGPGTVGFGVIDRALGAFPGSASLAGHSNGRFANGLFGYQQGAGNGVCGQADGTNGVGVVGFAQNGLGGLLAGGRANAALTPGGLPPFQRSDAHNPGELITDANGDLWLCIEAGSPGRWRHVAGPTPPQQLMVLQAPVRIYDSREGYAPLGVQKGKLGAGEERDIPVVASGTPVPPNGDVFVNITATETGPAGWLACYRPGQPWPGNSTVNWSARGSTVANLAAVPMLGSLFRLKASDPTHVVADLLVIVTPRIINPGE